MFEFLKKLFKKNNNNVQELFEAKKEPAVEMGGNYCTDNC